MRPFRNQRSRQVVSLLIAVVGVLLAWSPARNAFAGESPFPVRVSANGRYLQDAGGKPFLLHGDTAWSLILQLSKEEAEEYLENRRQKGFNAILTVLTWTVYADDPPRNKYGDAPFTTLGDLSTPNEAYFAHADWVFQKAREKGILVVLNPAVTGFADDRGWGKQIVANGPANARWYNPTNGTYAAVEGSPFANRGSRDFTTRGDNGTGANDWVLVLESVASQPHHADGDDSPAEKPIPAAGRGDTRQPAENAEAGENASVAPAPAAEGPAARLAAYRNELDAFRKEYGG
ncbi:MAG: DUF4038 domain-containing protein, partial [Planctomycetes bacterium]|nr:DUF4038 domain-containing protein [Planctomycetota bacterium]